MVPGTQAGGVLRPFDGAGLWGDSIIFARLLPWPRCPGASCRPQEGQCALALRGSSACPTSLSWVL